MYILTSAIEAELERDHVENEDYQPWTDEDEDQHQALVASLTQADLEEDAARAQALPQIFIRVSEVILPISRHASKLFIRRRQPGSGRCRRRAHRSSSTSSSSANSTGDSDGGAGADDSDAPVTHPSSFSSTQKNYNPTELCAQACLQKEVLCG